VTQENEAQQGDRVVVDRAVPVDTGPSPASGQRPSRRADALMVLLAIGFTAVLTGGLWLDPNHRTFRINASDQAFFEWLLAYAANGLRHGHNPFWTDLMNTPGGVNLAANTAETVLGWLLAPVTLLLGPTVSYVLGLTFGIAATPIAWYLLLSRKLVRSPAAAIVGALFCGFAPGMVAHANGHLNFGSGYLVPLIVWRVLELRRPGKALRNGLILGVLIPIQYSLGGETLFFAALGCATVIGCLLIAGHREPRANVIAAGSGLSVAALTALVLLAYPLWMQFRGPGSFHGTGFVQSIHSEDLLAYGAFPSRSLSGLAGLSTRLAPNPTEENSFFGVPGLLLLIGFAILVPRHLEGARRRLALAVAVSAGVFAVLSLGPVLKVDHHRTGVPLPFALLKPLPLFDSALPGRFALVVAVLGGVLLALGLDTPMRHRRWVAAVVAVALLPLVPIPLRTMDRSGVPHFISSGEWRRYVQPGRTLIPVPPVSDLLPDGQRWQAYALSSGDGATFRIPAGFFLGPGGPNGRGRIGPTPRPTFTLLSDAALTGAEPATVTPAMREQARADARYWGGSVVALPVSPGTGNRWAGHYPTLLRVATDLYGPPTRVDDMWLWQLS
jgi:hypothetical protein